MNKESDIEAEREYGRGCPDVPLNKIKKEIPPPLPNLPVDISTNLYIYSIIYNFFG
jgi:hypothetical protein